MQRPACAMIFLAANRSISRIHRSPGRFLINRIKMYACVTKNKDFHEAGERIPTNILAHRLKLHVKHGLVEKRLYQKNPPRYEYHLTEIGKGLVPVIESMARWTGEYNSSVTFP
jgi:DNA-binding HxlR family transcriptional regulator